MLVNEYCNLLHKKVEEGECVEIIAELYGGKKEKRIVNLLKGQQSAVKEIELICRECPNYPC